MVFRYAMLLPNMQDVASEDMRFLRHAASADIRHAAASRYDDA